MNPGLKISSCIVFMCTLFSMTMGQSAEFIVASMEGSAKVQRSQKKNWDALNSGDRIGDNDIIETFFQARCIIRFGDGNTVILGSNSKALLNITTQPSGGKVKYSASLTLFSGGIFAKAISNAFISIYTSNGVAETEDGAISAVVNQKSGETGFQVLSGTNVTARNVAQQQGRRLTAGQTTMILPGREPTAPLFLTQKHANVLKHFFGDEYISKELENSGIKPTDVSTQGNKIRLSQSLMMGGAGKQSVDLGMYKRLFVLNDIYESIFNDEQQGWTNYSPIENDAALFNSKGDLGISLLLGKGGEDMRTSLLLTPSFSLSALKLGLRLRMGSNYAGQFGLHSFKGGLGGILDLINVVQLGDRLSSKWLYVGAINDYSIGNGFVVDDFSNKNAYSFSRPLGLLGHLFLNEKMSIDAFVGDLSNFGYGGVHALFEPAGVYLGVGYYFDFNQYRPISALELNRFVETKPTLDYAVEEALHLAELNLGMDIVYTERMRIGVTVDYAHKLFNGRDGYMLRVPNLSVDWHGMHFGGGFTYEKGRAIIGQFGWNYPSRRYWAEDTVSESLLERVGADSAANIPRLYHSYNGSINRSREAAGIHLEYAFNPLSGIDLKFKFKHDFSQTMFGVAYDSTEDSSGSLVDTFYLRTPTPKRIPVQEGFDFNLTVAVNDSLIEYIKYGELHIRQTHGGIFPRGSSFFKSWGFNAGLYVLSNPVINNLAFELGVDYFYLDLDGKFNDKIDKNDSVLEFFLGARWGFASNEEQ